MKAAPAGRQNAVTSKSSWNQRSPRLSRNRSDRKLMYILVEGCGTLTLDVVIRPSQTALLWPFAPCALGLAEGSGRPLLGRLPPTTTWNWVVYCIVARAHPVSLWRVGRLVPAGLPLYRFPV